MPTEVLEALTLRPGQFAVDATVGAGGHSALLLETLAPGGRLLCLDVDPEALELARARLEPLAAARRVHLDLVQANFRELPAVLAQTSAAQAPHAILADLGLSSMQLDRPERGFSFRHDAPLDLRMDPTLPRTGADLLRELSEQELADLLYRLSNERGARRIARAVVQAREHGEAITTTAQLARLVLRAQRVHGHFRIHPATRTFQALRIAVNQELEALEAFLQAAPGNLAAGGVLVVISFHSGEDRLVKHGFKALAVTGRFQLLRKSVLRPGPEERSRNPRSRSARFRALRRV